ncbi:MAG: FtsW/RodA/SpoVE family cell cycle protein [Chloroflexi bacterium]|nr:FtsW/RodA/SpoVE family cell cycle protein [Chloroflexota bacterium]
MRKEQAVTRPVEGMALILIAIFLLLAFFSANAALQVRQGLSPWTSLPGALLPPLLVIVTFTLFHRFLALQNIQSEQILFPVVCLLFSVGLVVIWRLRGADGAWQQISRGFLPGILLAGLLVARPQWIEHIRRWAIPLCMAGLALPVLTGLFGSVDETGARLALKIGPLPAIQTSEPLKLILIIFLAWFIEQHGQVAEGRGHILFGWLRLPAFKYFVPGVLFVVLATGALVLMADYGAVLILACIFIGLLYVGFEMRTFLAVIAIGAALALLMGLILTVAWEVPAVIQYRFQAFQDPWSREMILVNGQPSGVTIADGPGYQIQQAIYAVTAGGITGSGLGFGSPDYVPLAYSDFIFAAVVEELGSIIGAAILFLFAVLLLRIFRAVLQLPPELMFERLMLVGIGVHLFTQVFVMVGGTLNVLPVTGVTIPFLSLGGMALITNLVEIGLVLALIRRQEMAAQDV